MQLPPELKSQLAEQKKQCIFCKIISKQTPAQIVFEDSKTLALLDIYPAVNGHTLYLLKEHYPILPYLSEEELRKEGQQKETQWHTLVYRSYPPFRGKGLMGAFVRFAIQKYRERYPDVKLWVGLNEANAASVALATTLGFHKREDLVDAEARWFAMTQE